MEHDRPPHHHPLPRRSSLCVCCCCCLKFHKAADISQSQPFCGVYGVCVRARVPYWIGARVGLLYSISTIYLAIFICIQCWRRFRDFLGPHKYMPSPKCDSNITGTNPISISLSDVVVLAISWVVLLHLANVFFQPFIFVLLNWKMHHLQIRFIFLLCPSGQE